MYVYTNQTLVLLNFREIEREGVAGQVAFILDTVSSSTDGVKLVSSLRNSIILSIISPSIVLFLFVILIILSIDIKSDEEKERQDYEWPLRQGIMTAFSAVGMATVGVVLTTLAVVRYNNALPTFEKTQEICRPLYELPECRSQVSKLANTMTF